LRAWSSAKHKERRTQSEGTQMACYPKTPYTIGQGSMVLSCNRMGPHPVPVRPDLPGAVIVVHGVNDVGTSYGAVEEGLCKGLSKRLGYEKPPFKPGTYRSYNPQADGNKLLEDPDAVFYKRQFDDKTNSPVIPFYWGFRERSGAYKTHVETVHGQATDRYGNRLDKDYSKGGGPFNNATSNLIDMWNSGSSKLSEVVDKIAADPLRPMLKSPGRMYMVLAAQRLAALISMIRDYNGNDRISIVAHSQGCLVSLLAQAFLMDQPECKPADTLILTHPPYSLVKGKYDFTSTGGGTDAAMAELYEQIKGQQTMKARLDTLIRIVNGVGANHQATTEADLKWMRDNGIHGAAWEPGKDRDNRGKVYLYFCPEDMTVALPTVQGIGWQGVPHDIAGTGLEAKDNKGKAFKEADFTRRPLKELGQHFYQRVFTAKRRPLPGQAQAQPFKVGLAPQEFVLRQEDEDDHAHVAPGSRTLRAELPETDRDGKKYVMVPLSDQERRHGLRYISGEALPEPVAADMYAGAITQPGSPVGAHESVDPIDAAIGVTSQTGRRPVRQQEIADPRPATQRVAHGQYDALGTHELRQVEAAFNEDKAPGEKIELVHASHRGPGQLLITRLETGNEARLRHQQSTSERSFHGAIIGSAKNHEQVTAYDLAVGRGDAVSHPKFYAYLCAVADWRLKKLSPKEWKRPGIALWPDFLVTHSAYWKCEPEWRKKLIEGNCTYYSTGELPVLPLITALPTALVSETDKGVRIERRTSQGKGGKA
jgi:pimeloyl-ACP methyl ester carboxylesterase